MGFFSKIKKGINTGAAVLENTRSQIEKYQTQQAKHTKVATKNLKVKVEYEKQKLALAKIQAQKEKLNGGMGNIFGTPHSPQSYNIFPKRKKEKKDESFWD